jgi:transcriptional regulator with XRE-family HTH domain
MSVPSPALSSAANQAKVLSKAVVRAAEHLGITRSQLASILGVSAATLSRLHSGTYLLDARRKEWELALLFVRAFRSLDSIVGDAETARQWLSNENSALNARRVELLSQTEGLVRVVQYLDASRGRV